MRVIGGKLKGRRLASFSCEGLRPTSDKTREAIFNVLGDFEFIRVLDIFAGTGALGIEALSRTLARTPQGFCVFIDDSKKAGAIINKNLEATELAENARILTLDAIKAIELLKREAKRAKAEARDIDQAFNLVFIDAPYKERGLTLSTLQGLADSKILATGAIIIAEGAKKDIDTDNLKAVNGLRLIKEKTYGDTTVCFFEFL
jgi:16S rRNA (guanine(966)-N(2))-methyltransferase RsmD